MAKKTAKKKVIPVSNPYVLTPHPDDHSLPRGIRNANPGNCELGEPWQGLLPQSQQTDGRFAIFKTAHYGLRALAKILVNYQRLHGLMDVHSMIERWAPPGENDTRAYAAQVASAMGITPTTFVSFAAHGRQPLIAMVKAIVSHENGQQPYDEDYIGAACDEALAP